MSEGIDLSQLKKDEPEGQDVMMAYLEANFMLWQMVLPKLQLNIHPHDLQDQQVLNTIQSMISALAITLHDMGSSMVQVHEAPSEENPEDHISDPLD